MTYLLIQAAFLLAAAAATATLKSRRRAEREHAPSEGELDITKVYAVNGNPALRYTFLHTGGVTTNRGGAGYYSHTERRLAITWASGHKVVYKPKGIGSADWREVGGTSTLDLLY